jgi:hypothetical protein
MPQAQVAEYWLHPQGVYQAQLKALEDKAGNWGPQIQWTWETPELQFDEEGQPILNDDGTQRKGRLVDFTSCTASAKSNLGKLLTALGIPLPTTKEEAAEMNDAWFKKLIGKRVTVQVIHNLLPDGRIFANIQSFAPIGKGGTKGETKTEAPATTATSTPASPAPAPAPAPAPEGCPDPSYDHSLKQGDEGYDPFHSETCPGMKQAA